MSRGWSVCTCSVNRHLAADCFVIPLGVLQEGFVSVMEIFRGFSDHLEVLLNTFDRVIGNVSTKDKRNQHDCKADPDCHVVVCDQTSDQDGHAQSFSSADVGGEQYVDHGFGSFI